MARRTLKNGISAKIRRSCKEVFKRSDFEQLAAYDQVGRALHNLAREGALIKIGYGLYAKARVNRITGQKKLRKQKKVMEHACAVGQTDIATRKT